MLSVRLAGLMRGKHAMVALLSSETMAAPLHLAASEAGAGPARGDPGVSRVIHRGQDLSNQSAE